jgi:hypothetical protein
MEVVFWARIVSTAWVYKASGTEVAAGTLDALKVQALTNKPMRISVKALFCIVFILIEKNYSAEEMP